jgi:type IV pilus assembly protein PilN
MMIRINLLPVRQVKKREAGRQILILFGVVLLAAVGGNAFWFVSRSNEHDDNQKKIAKTKAEIAQLEKVIGEVNNINKRKKELEDKQKILDELRKGRSGPVRLMDALSVATPKKVWLKSFAEANGAVKIDGTALSHDDLAELMRNMGTMVWTPKGMGRLVEQKRDAKTARVELLDQEGAIEDFALNEIGHFFKQIELKTATQKGARDALAKQVEFQLQVSASYAL